VHVVVVVVVVVQVVLLSVLPVFDQLLLLLSLLPEFDESLLLSSSLLPLELESVVLSELWCDFVPHEFVQLFAGIQF
jgi:hypothetical protein